MTRRLIMFAVVAVVLVLAGWYLLLWSPASSDLDEAKARKTAAQQRQAQVQSEITRLRAAQRNEPQNRAKLETLRIAIPDDPALGQLIIDLNDAATRSGINFMSISPTLPRAAPVAAATTATTAAGSTATTNTTIAGTTVTPSAASQAPAEIGIALQIKGGYFQVLDFLNRLDALPRLMVTDTLTMTSDDRAVLTVGINARAFLRSVPPEYGGAATTTTSTTAPAGGAGGTTTTTASGGGTGATTTTAPGGTTTTTGARP